MLNPNLINVENFSLINVENFSLIDLKNIESNLNNIENNKNVNMKFNILCMIKKKYFINKKLSNIFYKLCDYNKFIIILIYLSSILDEEKYKLPFNKELEKNIGPNGLSILSYINSNKYLKNHFSIKNPDNYEINRYFIIEISNAFKNILDEYIKLNNFDINTIKYILNLCNH